jgi:hypothetical protein
MVSKVVQPSWFLLPPSKLSKELQLAAIAPALYFCQTKSDVKMRASACGPQDVRNRCPGGAASASVIYQDSR